MGNFRSNGRGGFGGRSSGGYGPRSRFGGGGKFSGDRGSGRSDRMYDATCSKCGRKCQVPFKPTGTKPIYCDDCFKHNDQGNMDGRSRSEVSSEQFNQINTKLDRILRAIENLEIDAEDEPEEDFGEDDEDPEDEADEEDSNDK